MKVELISKSDIFPDDLCGKAAAICCDSEDDKKSLNIAIKNRHESILEHANFTFKICSVSSVLLAQLTRHRFFSFSVRSERYCGGSKDYVIPQTIANNENAIKEFYNHLYLLENAYNRMMSLGIPKEDARYILPKATTYDIIATANARELLRFFELRCCNRAQWEIRELANAMRDILKVVSPVIFDNAGAYCERHGFCPEGKNSCGRAITYEDAKGVYYLLDHYVNEDEVALHSRLDKMFNKYLKKRGVK